MGNNHLPPKKIQNKNPEEPTNGFGVIPLIRKVITGIVERTVFGCLCQKIFSQKEKRIMLTVFS